MNIPDERRQIILALSSVQVVFASLAIVGKVALNVVPPMALVSLRVTGSALVFLALAALSRRALLPPREARSSVLLLATTGMVLNQVLFMIGLHLTSAIEGAVITAIVPIITLVYAVFSGREPARIQVWLGMALALAGAMLVARPQRIAITDAHLVGNALVFLNAISYSIYLVRGRVPMMRFGAENMITWMFVTAAIIVAPVGIPSLVSHAGQWSVRTWIVVAYVIVGPSAFAYAMNAWALARAPSSLVAVFIYLQPALTIAMAITLGDPLARWLRVAIPHETLSWQTSLGVIGVFFGVYVSARKPTASKLQAAANTEP